MRTLLIAGTAWLLMTATHAAEKNPASASANLAERWATRLGPRVEDAVRQAAAGDKVFATKPAPAWKVSASGDDVVIERVEPVAMSVFAANASVAEDATRPAGQHALRLVLRFIPLMTQEEYDRLATENVAARKEHDRLHRELNLPHKFDDFIATSPAEKQQLKDYRAAIAKLPHHELPTFYSPDASIHLIYQWDGWTTPSDKTVQAELNAVEERLIDCLGVYDDELRARTGFMGEHVAAD